MRSEHGKPTNNQLEQLEVGKNERTESFTLLPNPEFRNDLRTATRMLIHEIIMKRIDAVIFLDKSARPFAWLLKELWQHDQIQEDLPTLKFINPGTGPETHLSGSDRIGKIDGRIVRGTLSQEEDQKRGVDQLRQAFRQQFDGKKILLVDEIKSSGQTMFLMSALFREAFPGAVVDTTFLFTAKQCDIMPWAKPGSLGIVEEDRNIFVAPLTQKRIDIVRDNIFCAVEGKLKDSTYAGEIFSDVRDRFAEGKNRQIADSIQQTLSKMDVPPSARSAVRQALESSNIFRQEPPASNNPQFWSQYICNIFQVQFLLENASNRWNEDPSTLHDPALPDDKKKLNSLIWKINQFVSVFLSMDRIMREYAEYGDLDYLNQYKKQLRAEIKALAREE